MSERWGKCKTCKGIGEIADETKPIEQDARAVINAPGKPGEYIFTRSVRGFQGRECGSCQGTGFNGDSQDCPY